METIIDTLSWPPAYNLRLSKKARHVHLKVIPNQGLEVIVPIRQQKRVIIADLLAEKKSWIEKHLATLKIKPLEAITSFSLQAINQTWHIEYQQTTSQQIHAIVRPGDATTHFLTLCGDVKDIPRTQRWLKGWLKQQAQEHLIPWLQTLSIEHGLPFNKAAIRAQRTLWGSCTADKNISLNYKLLFIPRLYAEHIMLHELCHTKHLNHSKRFWDLLTKVDNHCDFHNKAVREADKHIPAFFT